MWKHPFHRSVQVCTSRKRQDNWSSRKQAQAALRQASSQSRLWYSGLLYASSRSGHGRCIYSAQDALRTSELLDRTFHSPEQSKAPAYMMSSLTIECPEAKQVVLNGVQTNELRK
eukprot:12248-Heterococcus_DN1.PRE.10